MSSPEQPSADPAQSRPNKHTAMGIALNLLLLAMIAYGFWQSEQWRLAWALVAIPIAVVTVGYIRHWIRRDHDRP